MRANDGAVDYRILVVPVGGQRIEHPLPDAGMAPATEARCTGFHLPSRSAGRTSARLTGAPTDIRSRKSGYPIKNDSDRPLSPAAEGQSSPTAHRSTHTACPLSSAPRLNTDADESVLNTLRNPECRSTLGVVTVVSCHGDSFLQGVAKAADTPISPLDNPPDPPGDRAARASRAVREPHRVIDLSLIHI